MHLLRLVGAFAFFALMAAIVALSGYLLYEDFRGNMTARAHVASMVSEACDSLVQRSGEPLRELSPVEASYVERIEAAGKSALDSSLISFFFQVLSLALISGGLFLLTRAHASVEQTEDRAREVRDIAKETQNSIQANQVGSATTTYASSVYHATCGLASNNDDQLPDLRDLLKSLERLLDRTIAEKIKPDRNSCAISLNFLTFARNNLSSIDGLEVPDVIESCNTSIELLKLLIDPV